MFDHVDDGVVSVPASTTVWAVSSLSCFAVAGCLS